MASLRFLLALISLGVASLAAEAMTNQPAASDPALTRRVIREIAATQAHQFFLATVKWTTLGGLAGVTLSLVWIAATHAAGLFRSGWRYEAWVRWLLWVFLVLATAGALSVAGFWKGVVRGSEQVLLHSQIGTQALPLVGQVAADGMAAIQLYLAETNRSAWSPKEINRRLEAFRDGTWEVNAPGFARDLHLLPAEVATNLLPQLWREAVTRVPQLDQNPMRDFFQQGVRVLEGALSGNRLDGHLEQAGVSAFLKNLREKLVAEAARTGPPETIGRPELAAFMVQEGIVPAILVPIRSFARSQRNLCLLGAALALVGPPLLFRLTCGRVRGEVPPPLVPPAPPVLHG